MLLFLLRNFNVYAVQEECIEKKKLQLLIRTDLIRVVFKVMFSENEKMFFDLESTGR